MRVQLKPSLRECSTSHHLRPFHCLYHFACIVWLPGNKLILFLVFAYFPPSGWFSSLVFSSSFPWWLFTVFNKDRIRPSVVGIFSHFDTFLMNRTNRGLYMLHDMALLLLVFVTFTRRGRVKQRQKEKRPCKCHQDSSGIPHMSISDLVWLFFLVAGISCRRTLYFLWLDACVCMCQRPCSPATGDWLQYNLRNRDQECSCPTVQTVKVAVAIYESAFFSSYSV